jgi:hypothetical protein
MDVGVDTHDFRPWHFDEIRDRMDRIRVLVDVTINLTGEWAFCSKASHGILRLSIRHPFGWPIVERSFGFAFLVHRYLYRRGVA